MFFLAFYCYFQSEDVSLPFKEAISLTLSFIGSIGTIASIIFALYFYNKQLEEQNNIKKLNQPLFMLSASDLKKSKDSTGQPSYTLGFNIENFGHLASSFSLTNLGLPGDMDNKIIAEIPNSFISIFNRGDSYNFDVNISNIFYIQSYPDMENIRFDLLLSYMDKFNSSKFEVYSLSLDKDGKPKLKGQKDHHLLTLNE